MKKFTIQVHHLQNGRRDDASESDPHQRAIFVVVETVKQTIPVKSTVRSSIRDLNCCFIDQFASIRSSKLYNICSPMRTQYLSMNEKKSKCDVLVWHNISNT